VLVVRCNAWTASSLPFLNPRSLPISSTMVTLTVLRHSKDLQLASLTAFTSYLSSESIDACTRSSSSPFERCVCSDPAYHIPCTCRMIPYMTAMLIRPIENIVYVCTCLICPSYICMCLSQQFSLLCCLRLPDNQLLVKSTTDQPLLLLGRVITR
jgi:hypothetical protein